MSAALKLLEVDNPLGKKERLADEKIIVTGEGRAIAVAAFRELADRLESGELDGARVQWRRQSEEESLNGDPSELTVVTVSADAAYQIGTVALRVFTIKEG